MKYTIDRFEGEIAVVELENGKFADVPKIALPKEACESDIITLYVDREATEKRRNEIRELEKSLFND